MSVLSDFVHTLETFFVNEFHQIEAVAEELAPQILQKVEIALSDLGHIAVQAVINEAPKFISGQDKFENAVTAILNIVESQGKTVVLETAKAVVQVAYVGLQNVVKDIK